MGCRSVAKAAAHFGGCGVRGQVEELETRSLVRRGRRRPAWAFTRRSLDKALACSPPGRRKCASYRDYSLGERGRRDPSRAVPPAHQGVSKSHLCRARARGKRDEAAGGPWPSGGSEDAPYLGCLARLAKETSAQASRSGAPHLSGPLPALGSSVLALRRRFPSSAQGAPLPPWAAGPSSPALPPASPPPAPPPSERERGIPRPRTSPGARTGPGAAGRQSPRGGEAGARLRRAGGASWRCWPREPQTLTATQSDARTAGRARTQRPGRLRSEARARPGPGAPPGGAGGAARAGSGGRAGAGRRSRGVPRRPARDVSADGGSHLAPHLERRAPGRRGECAPPAAAAPAPDHGVRPPARVRPPRRPLGPAVGAGGARARG